MTRLSTATLNQARLARGLRYDRAAVRTGIVHLGIGAFHRAHQAAFVDDVLAGGDPRWGIRGASLRSLGVRDQLNPQDGLYTLLVREGTDAKAQLIGAVRDVLVAPEDPAALIAAMAHPDVKIVSLTITEKGYKLDPATGALNDADPEVRADLGNPERPVTAIGYLYAALAARHRAGLKPFTVLSCDNLPHNGARTRGAVLAFAERLDPVLADWIAGDGAFPASMVDRIVPATLPQDIDRLAAQIGVIDQGMVKTEPFRQWVIEDSFADGRPDFASVGVQLTRDVAGWEHAKLRLLNGAHSSLAYLGGLAGLRFMHQCVAERGLAGFLQALWDEAASTLAPVEGLDVAVYRASLAARFANVALEHKTHQIAMDGSQKLPQRLLSSIRARLASGAPFEALALGVAGWMAWQLGQNEAGEPHTVDDPLAARLTALAAEAGRDAPRLMTAMLSVREVFDTDLPADPRLRAAVERQLARLLSSGAVEAAARVRDPVPA